MNKLMIAALAALILLPGLLCAEELKLSGELWNRWILESGTAPGDSADATLRNNFSLERGYLGLEPRFSETVKGCLTVDIFSTELSKDGAGLKLKYAYLDFARLIPIPDLTTTIGLRRERDSSLIIMALRPFSASEI